MGNALSPRRRVFMAEVASRRQGQGRGDVCHWWHAGVVGALEMSRREWK
jgi:hypothetical protein